MTSRGTLVHFDGARGFGFVAPDAGGEDVFIHVNDFEDAVVDERSLRPGAVLEFEVERGGRGLKAVHARLARRTGFFEPPAEKSLAHASPARPSDETVGGEAEPRPAFVFPSLVPAPNEVTTLSADEFALEITEMLLDASSSLTSHQVLAIRRRFAEFAGARGWIRDA